MEFHRTVRKVQVAADGEKRDAPVPPIIEPLAASTAHCFRRLIAGRWIDEAQNLVVEGPAGVGKSWLACALGQKACRDNRSVLYQRARGDGRYPRSAVSSC